MGLALVYSSKPIAITDLERWEERGIELGPARTKESIVVRFIKQE